MSYFVGIKLRSEGTGGFHWNGLQTKVHENRATVIKISEWAEARGHVYNAK
jgi:hypothetical protein